MHDNLRRVELEPSTGLARHVMAWTLAAVWLTVLIVLVLA